LILFVGGYFVGDGARENAEQPANALRPSPKLRAAE
jgi:hypothetical protein